MISIVGTPLAHAKERCGKTDNLAVSAILDQSHPIKFIAGVKLSKDFNTKFAPSVIQSEVYIVAKVDQVLSPWPLCRHVAPRDRR